MNRNPNSGTGNSLQNEGGSPPDDPVKSGSGLDETHDQVPADDQNESSDG